MCFIVGEDVWNGRVGDYVVILLIWYVLYVVEDLVIMLIVLKFLFDVYLGL